MKALTANPAAATNLTNAVPPAVSYGAGSPGSYTLTGLVIGQAYCWIPGANETSIVVNANVTLAKADLPAGGCFTATATTATMKGTGSALVTAIVSMTTLLYPTTVTPTLPVRQITLGQIPAANPNWVRQIQCSDQFVFIKRPPSYAVAISLADFVNIGLSQEINLTWTPPIILTQPATTTVAHTVQASLVVVPGSEYILTYAWYASSDNVNWSDAITTATGLFSVAPATAGTGYTVGDVLTGTGMTGTAPTFKVTSISGGGGTGPITGVAIVTHGSYTGNPTGFTGGTGASATFTFISAAFDVATAGTLKVTPALAGLAYFKCTITDDAAAYGLTNGSVTTNAVTLTVT